MNSSSPISINDDLILDIISRLPSESIARFRCLSKQWASMLNTSPYFKELFQTRSSAKPHLIFAIVEKGVWSFFSLPQLENPYEQSNLVAAADFHVKFSHDDLQTNHSDDIRNFSYSYASGLFFLHGCGGQDRALTSNPITGRYAILPYTYKNLLCCYGFDPIDKQYKALRMASPFDHETLTIGDGDMKWRKVKCSLPHAIMSEGICINGVLYYIGYTASTWIIVCFDLRSEKFTFIGVESLGKLINYKGKLALIHMGNEYAATKELHMWVLDDIEKNEWRM
ncbi:PREDICTED: F-box protein At2g16450-like [Camelina sativa]|uniref:F-box protein At2g16450-like n=1 Tax=Camelina sativa TaxID=90675 RepID=A0ABM1RKQ8_CAMSA|nr:PREDICTED: F-box protein At2g16450-like [Camelina sativa]